ncbi:UPF0481 protein At3g47200-like [Pyrus x bretschneideri]|uniref:UPF0481 protein At3g47200-like n=1 Tax=Pyrus x bretschneideri TaxID=225117 RepID=UPI00202F772B|nr:UPF0481 protein At3g47200-like [Pyrus x bretschneideri]XP_048438758.1 UPF0481 protein At3g47200-like [Pyrus x bretschneideri]XP_048438766.1 UPF0481 protein At3g47200-like [Pyrus x bretschneideri]
MERSNEAPQNPGIQLATSMSEELGDLTRLSASCCIYKVPERLRCVNEKAYTPQVVSIGPIHHGKKGLEDMEEHKKRYLQHFLNRTKVSLEVYVTKIQVKEPELRSCYAHNIGLSSDEFVRIILVDAAFIIELLLRYCSPIQLESNDGILNKPWLKKFIIPDMLLLENQLPFFILEDLFATAEVLAMMPSVFVLSYIFCMESTSLHVKRDDSGSFSSFKVEHFVDLIRTLHLPTEEENSKYQRPFEASPVPSMTTLHQAGVKFKARSSNNLFDIRFKDGSLEIPNLMIAYSTELLLRNLIAFEQCHCDCNYFSDYIFLMDNLVNTPNDVELLVKNGIVENLLGDKNKVSTLINSLGKGVVFDKASFYYATLTADINKYYKKPWNEWKANLKQKYFNTTWDTISVIGAPIAIILTFVQTVCSVYQSGQR